MELAMAMEIEMEMELETASTQMVFSCIAAKCSAAAASARNGIAVRPHKECESEPDNTQWQTIVSGDRATTVTSWAECP